MEAVVELLMATATGLGDAAVTMPVAAILFAAFLLASRPMALRWLCAVALCGGVTALGKLALYIHGQPIPAIWLGSPSGHAAASVLVYGALSVAVSQARPRFVPVAFAVLTVLLIAVSRVYLRDHTGADVVAGVAIGGACLAWFVPGRAAEHAWPVRAGALASIAVCLAGTAMGWHLPLDAWLRAVAAQAAAV